ncbi:MAG: RNA polymerase sigma factor [Anaerovoracaceae bacterium]
MIEEKDNTMVHIIEKYNRLIYKIVCERLHNPDFVAEAVQEILLVIYKAADKIFILPEEEQKKYICAICRNISVRIFNIEARQQGISLDDENNFIEIVEDFCIDEKISDLKFGSDLDYCIRQLTEEEQEIVIRFYEYGQSHEDIAKALGISAVSSRKKLSRIKRKLAKLLEQERAEHF